MSNQRNKYPLYVSVWILMVFLQMFSACNRLEDDIALSDEVKLTASLSPVLSSVYTKGNGEIKSTYQDTLHIGIAKVVGNDGNFEEAESMALPAVMQTPSDNMGLRDIKFNDFQGFPDATNKLHYTAWYPRTCTYSNPAEGKTTVTFEIPTDASTDILYSDVTSGNRLSGFKPLTFQHALVKYTIKVYAMEEDVAAGSVSDVWGQIQSVTLADMPSQCVLNLPSTTETVSDVSFAGTMNLTKQISNFGQIPVGFSKAAELAYFLAPPPTNLDKVLNIKMVTERSANGKNVKTSIARDFQPGMHYQIYLRFTTHGIVNAEIVSGEWEDNKDYLHVDTNTGVHYDLSESHTANSYVVSSAFSYCFDATVRGNGFTGLAAIPGAPTDVFKVNDPVKAEIVWTDLVTSPSENLDEIFLLAPNIVNGRVFFTVKPGPSGVRSLKKEGNVVIGVKDASGNWLWTWHIWLTDRPSEQGYKNGFNAQDRDLGAIAYDAINEPSGINGMFYQWGRPTPLPLGKTVYRPVYNASGAWVENEEVTFNHDEVNAPSMVGRVMQPTTFFKAKATSSEGTLTKSLWGWRTETDEYAKTIYDPCPPGYRMPSIKLWRDLKIHSPRVLTKTVNSETQNIAIAFQVDVNNLDIYYPMTGYYTSPEENNHVDDGVGAYMWAATYNVGEKENYADDDRPYALDFALENSVLKEMEKRLEYSNYALPVRCVSRMSKAHVTNLSDYQTANSYIVSKNGLYKFKATVRGNGIGQLVSPGSTSTIVLTEQLQSVDIKNQLVQVKPLWWKPAAVASGQNEVEAPNLIMLNKGNPDADGYVMFELETFNEGNLILAGYDAKGEIIWSWHIWFTDEPKMMRSNSFVVMDRNLGATHAPAGTTAPDEENELEETYGLYYQWGRKDPFPVSGANVYEYNGSGYTLITAFGGNSSFSTESDAAGKTLENSVKNPMTFNLASTPQASEGIFNNDNFFSSYSVTEDDNAIDNQNFSNMVYPDNKKSFWGYSAATGYGVTTTKTMYDPCPPGYITAHYLIWTNTERDGSSSVNYYSNLDTGWKTHSLGKSGGFFTTKHNDLFDPAWYPFAGYINGKDGLWYKEENMGIIHTSTPAGLGSRSLAYNSTYSGQIVDYNYRGLPSTFAYPVRCQKE